MKPTSFMWFCLFNSKTRSTFINSFRQVSKRSGEHIAVLATEFKFNMYTTGTLRLVSVRFLLLDLHSCRSQLSIFWISQARHFVSQSVMLLLVVILSFPLLELNLIFSMVFLSNTFSGRDQTIVPVLILTHIRKF